MQDRREEKIERLERRILKAHRVSPEELREIVSAPQLFDKINARIKLARQTDESPAVSGTRAKFPVWNWRKTGLAFGALAVFLTTATGFIFFPRADFSVAHLTASVAAPAIERQTASVEKPDTGESEKTDKPPGASLVMAKKPAFKNKISKSARRVTSMSTREKTRPPSAEPEEAFYPLAFADGLEEAKEAGQVIRVELSRSSLLALGVNPPNNDENLKVKTDLLIGTDGVARGIRFVK